jgi:hypothetical protein
MLTFLWVDFVFQNCLRQEPMVPIASLSVMLLRMQKLRKCSGEQHDLWVSFTSNPLNELLHSKWWEPSRTVNRWMSETTDLPKSTLQCDCSRGRCRCVRGWRRGAVFIPRYVVLAIRLSSIPVITGLVHHTGVRTRSTSRGVVARPDWRELDYSLLCPERAGKSSQVPPGSKW